MVQTAVFYHKHDQSEIRPKILCVFSNYSVSRVECSEVCEEPCPKKSSTTGFNTGGTFCFALISSVHEGHTHREYSFAYTPWVVQYIIWHVLHNRGVYNNAKGVHFSRNIVQVKMIHHAYSGKLLLLVK